jgi:hypothetical protein
MKEKGDPRWECGTSVMLTKYPPTNPHTAAHSSQLTAHSSQLTAHSSQLTAHSSELRLGGATFFKFQIDVHFELGINYFFF